MVKALVATVEGTLKRLMTKCDRDRLDSIADVTWRTDLDKFASEEDYSKAISKANAEIVMTGWSSPRLTMRVMKENPGLKAIINITGEIKHYLDRDCLEAGIIASNWGSVPAASVAEATLMMTLASLRRAWYWQDQMHYKRSWGGLKDPSHKWSAQGLFDRTLGLYGFGLIAREFAKMVKPFGVKPLVFTGWLTPEEKKEYNVESVETLEELFSRCDVVSIHTGNRPDTFHSVNADILSCFSDGSHLINTARGPIIDESALADELRKGRIFAALDVFEEEPLPEDHPFRGLTNCILFPHNGGPTPDYSLRCGKLAVDQVERYNRGEEPLYRISLKQYDRMT